MTKIILSGCCGHMGRVVTDLCAEDPDISIAAGLDIADDDSLGYPVFHSPGEITVSADAVIDFSSSKATDALLDWCAENKMPLVLCTTGLSDEQVDAVRRYSEKTAILRSANMSIGINLLMKVVAEAAKLLAPQGYDMEIVEAHHHRKLDAPSGTALQLGESMNDALGGEYHFTFGRSDRHEKRDPKEIGISSVRGGTIVGIHNVMFAGEDEVIEFKHTAYSRAIFGKGAIAAAKFLAGKPAGLYDMSQVIG